MAEPAVNVGTGTTIGFSAGAYAAEVLNVSWSGISRPSIDTTHMGTVEANNFGGRTFMPGDLVDPGELTVEYHFDPDLDPLIDGAVVTITVTFPGTSTWAASGFCTAFEFTDPLEDKMVCSATFKITGGVTIA